MKGSDSGAGQRGLFFFALFIDLKLDFLDRDMIIRLKCERTSVSRQEASENNENVWVI